MSTTNTPPPGSGNSSRKGSSRLAKLTSEASLMLSPKTCAASASAIGLPGLADGPHPCASPDGVTRDLFGAPLSPASHSAPPASKKAGAMIATCGRYSPGSSASAALSEFLGNKLRKQLDSIGSMEYRQTWKRKATPLGRQFWAHIPSELRTGDNDCTGWPSPAAKEPGGTPEQAVARKEACVSRGIQMGCSVTHLAHAAQLAAWPSPKATNSNGASKTETRQGSADLTIAQLTGWATPRANDAEKRGEVADDPRNGLVTQANLSGWATPRAESAGMRHSRAVADTPSPLAGQDLSGWTTPQAHDANKRGTGTIRRAGTIGAISPSSHAGTESSAECRPCLSPAFSLWLQGFPVAWHSCGARAMRSVSRPPRRSSAQP